VVFDFRGSVNTPQFDVAVAIPTTLRPSLERAVRSVFGQDFKGRIQVLIGIDTRLHDNGCLDRLRAECPSHVMLTVIDLGYSTSARHGGTYANIFGGAMRTIMSYAAHSKYIAYLDDDDWWAPHHLSSLFAAIAGKVWAFSYRWMVDNDTGWPICRDEWDSVGPGRGINNERYGGFVSPSNLLIDKYPCHFLLPLWSMAIYQNGVGDDRLVFEALMKHHPWAATGKYTCYYSLRLEDQEHEHHAQELAVRNLRWMRDPAQIEMIRSLVREAGHAVESGDYGQAVALCTRALELNPYHVPSLRQLAAAERKTGLIAQALFHEQQASDIGGEPPAVSLRPVEAMG
jgi:hypothetical protein